MTRLQHIFDCNYTEKNDKKYCQAQSQLQVKLSLKTELALISTNPATHRGEGSTPFHQNNCYLHQQTIPLQTVPNGLKHKIKQ